MYERQVIDLDGAGHGHPAGPFDLGQGIGDVLAEPVHGDEQFVIVGHERVADFPAVGDGGFGEFGQGLFDFRAGRPEPLGEEGDGRGGEQRGGRFGFGRAGFLHDSADVAGEFDVMDGVVGDRTFGA